MQVTIKPTEKVQQLAGKAMDIQDACNPYPVTKFLMEVQDHFRGDTEQESRGTAMSIGNPISQALIGKLCSMSRIPSSESDCYGACIELRAGNEVSWEIPE
jgi:hypothetical protein